MGKTLKFGNGTWATKKGSTLAYNDLDGNFKPLPFTATRSTSATRVNKEGLIEVVENDRPRIDYKDSEDGVFLLEKAATNLFAYSEDFSQSYWGTSRIETPYIADTISPDGTLNAYTLEVSSGQTNGGGVFKTGISISGDNSFSVFAKKKTANYLALGDTGLTSNAVYFDLENGVVGATYNATGEIQDFGNGWYRCTMKYTLTSSGAKFIYLSNIDGLTLGGVQGGDSVYIYGAMLEQGNPSSYIPTQGTIQTRVQETASGSGNSEVFNSEGVLFANIAANSKGDGYKLISITDSNSGNSFVSIGMMNSTTQSYKQIRFGGVNLFTDFTDPINQTSFNKIAIKYKSGDSSFYVNGFEIDSSSVTYTTITPMTELKFSYFQDGDDFYGKTKEISYYDEILTDLELETLTSYRTWEAMVKELNLNIIHNE